ncbi:hypothetical protein J1614_005622, partial [Plenodomus biglobosus]
NYLITFPSPKFLITMDFQRSTATEAGSPEGQAALVALASTLNIDPVILRPILESAFCKVETGLAPRVALRVTCARFGYTYDSDAFESILHAFQRAFSDMFARSSVFVPSSATAAAPMRQNRPVAAPIPSARPPQTRPSASNSRQHRGHSTFSNAYHQRNLVVMQPQTVPGYWPADSGPAFDPLPPPPVGFQEGRQTYPGPSYLMPEAQGLPGYAVGVGRYNPPPKPTNWFLE